MKKLFLTAAFAFGVVVMQAQVKTPQASPVSKIDQTVGLTNLEIEYSRPSIKGRTVFGELVPYGKLWRTGANANTTISFSEDVTIDGKTLKKGKYSLYTLPKADSWEVIFYATTDNWGLPEKWDEANVVLRTLVKPETMSRKVETFSIDVNNIDNDFAVLEFIWEKTLVPVKFEVPTQKVALKSIETTLAGPTANDYFSAAQYIYQSNGDMKKALTWVNKACEMSSQPPFWFLRLKSLVQAKNGDKNGAIETAKQSLAAAEKANNQDYVKMNKDSINEWTKK